MLERSRIHLKGNAGDAAQRRAVSNDLIDDVFRATDNQRPLPNRKGVLHWPWVDSLPGQSRSELAGPFDVLVLTDLQEQLKLLLEECIVILKAEPEQGKGLD